MSSHEMNRVEVMGRVKNRDLKLSDAAVMLGVSYRQAKRLWRRYRKLGSEGLKHGNVGRASNRRKPWKVRPAGVEFNPQEVFGFRGGEVRSDLGRRTLSRRRRYRRGPRNAATVDAGRRIVESEAEAQEAFETTGAQSPFWRDGAAGWQLP